ncbi:peptidylprolyl isomerase [Amycolatopsis umgeniensis]|uniref:Peptidyl-prolyl cis-trans isomerase B (Cyclophilin B) n=1 Tax=Amycolatopsis umgeniensis TaxID=336628 RepID=A0A841AXI1_9PSEU|nr:peptidylprolyl isomerase [Amycolatopsis umgeniensis]MBB5850818.1 peptidyl-prolyl cis-trans isomerase B (cyclophilin B) [Amycolatopsis umgeniensis]
MSQPPQQPYQQPGWYGAPQQPPQPPPSNKTALWIGLGVLGLVVVVAVVAITGFVAPGFFLSDSKGKSAIASSSQTPTSSAQDTTTPQSQAQIPTDRLAMPKRTTPLADPANCAYPAKSDGEVPKKATPPAAGPTPASGTTALTVKTTAGDIGLTLDRALAPCTVANFLSLAQQGYYDGTSCHRLGTSGLQMLQCGDPAGNGTGGPGYTIPDEIFPELRYGRGILAMAKTQDPDSGGSQFFMVFGEAELPPEYTVFGSISDAGLQTLDKVARGGVDDAKGTGDGTGPPRIPVTFQSIAVG